MSSSDEIIGHVNPHAIKKFELIEKYVEAWGHIILLSQFYNVLLLISTRKGKIKISTSSIF